MLEYAAAGRSMAGLRRALVNSRANTLNRLERVTRQLETLDVETQGAETRLILLELDLEEIKESLASVGQAIKGYNVRAIHRDELAIL